MRRLAVAALLLAGAGCTRFEPEPLDPVAEYEGMAARGRTVETGATTSLLPVDLFPLHADVSVADGLTLAEANALALFHAPGLVAARRDLSLHGAELLRAGLLENPELSFGPRLTTADSILIFPASAAFEIPLGGRPGAEKDRAAAEIEAARRRLLDAEAKTLVEVRRRFISIAALERRQALLQRVVDASEAALSTTRQLLDAGRTDAVAFGLATLDRDEAVRELHKAKAEHAGERVGLLTSIGLLPDVGLAIHADPGLLGPIDLPAFDRDRLLRHTRLRALEASYRASEHSLEVEIAKQYPSIRLGPEYESDDGASSLGLGLTLTLPLFDTNAGGVAVAKEKRAGMRETWRAALLELAGRGALARLHHDEALDTLTEIRSNTIPAAEAAERALEDQQRSGRASIVETLATRNAIARARLREVELMLEAAVEGLAVLWYSGWLFDGTERDGDEGEER